MTSLRISLLMVKRPCFFHCRTNNSEKLTYVIFFVDWPEEQTEAARGSSETKHLWEESWDDDDTSDDFSAQLKCVSSFYRTHSVLSFIEYTSSP